MSQGVLPCYSQCQLRGDSKGLSCVATSAKANKLELKPRNTLTSWNSASRPHSCPHSLNTCKAELIRTDSIAFVSFLSQWGGRRGGDVLSKAQGLSCSVFPLRCRDSQWLGEARLPSHWPPHSCASRQGWGWRSVCSCQHGKEWTDVCLEPLVLLSCCPDFFLLHKCGFMVPGLLSCLQISVSFLLEQTLEARCSFVTKASWRARYSPTHWYKQQKWGAAHRYVFGQGERVLRY